MAPRITGEGASKREVVVAQISDRRDKRSIISGLRAVS